MFVVNVALSSGWN